MEIIQYNIPGMLQVEPYDAMQLFVMFFALSSKPNCLDICKHP